MWNITEKVKPKFAGLSYELWEDEDFLEIRYEGIVVERFSSLGATTNTVRALIKRHQALLKSEGIE